MLPAFLVEAVWFCTAALRALRVEVGHVCSVNLLSVNQMHKYCINDALAFPFMQK